jgi:uncharacterized protein
MCGCHSEGSKIQADRFLECAEAAGADVLLTGNKKHLPPTWKTTTVKNARQFLERIADEDLR